MAAHKWTAPGAQASVRMRGRPRQSFEMDIRDDRRGEYFWLSVGSGAHDRLEFLSLNIHPDLRHLVLLAHGPDVDTETHKTRFLCSHDERHWFAAVLPEDRGPVTTVAQAFEALKPAEVQRSQVLHEVQRSALRRRHNPGFIRQGEWFFVPAPESKPRTPSCCAATRPCEPAPGRHTWWRRCTGRAARRCM